MKKLLALFCLLSAMLSAQTRIKGVFTDETLAVTFSATPTFDASKANFFTITLTGNVTSSTLSNARIGQPLAFKICQDGTGGRTFVAPANVLNFVTIPGAANACIVETFVYDGTNALADQDVAALLISQSTNPATAGVERVASSDQAVCFRNNANGANVCLQKTGALASPFAADTLDATGFGGVKALQLFGTNVGGQSQAAFVGSGSTSIGIAFNSTGGAADQRWADCFLNNTTFTCRFVNDANNVGNAFWTVNRGAGAAVGTMTTGSGGGVQTVPSATGNYVLDSAAQTLSAKALTGAGSGNSVTLMTGCPPQDTLGAVTGNGTDQTIYTCTIPANTVQAGKCLRLTVLISSNNAVAVTYKPTLGATVLGTIGNSSGVESDQFKIDICNNAGVQNAQVNTFFALGGTAIISNNSTTSAENFANALVLKITANEVAANTVTPKKWLPELIQ